MCLCVIVVLENNPVQLNRPKIRLVFLIGYGVMMRLPVQMPLITGDVEPSFISQNKRQEEAILWGLT